MSNEENSESLDKYRIRYNFYALFIAFVLIGAVFIYAIFTATKSDDITNILSALTGIVGTIIGAFFGFTVGSEGKQDAIKTRDRVMEERNELANIVEDYLDKYDDLNKTFQNYLKKNPKNK
jgi:membrane protein DedA with SNARE-associated domain